MPLPAERKKRRREGERETGREEEEKIASMEMVMKI